MSAVSLPPTNPTRPADRATERSAHRHLRLVESPPRQGLAHTGPLQAWRRRLGALVVLAALLVLGGQALLGGAAPSEPAVVPASATTVVVQPGQTLWDVASTHAPEGVAVDRYVQRLAELNGISAGALDAWQVLRLPID